MLQSLHNLTSIKMFTSVRIQKANAIHYSADIAVEIKRHVGGLFLHHRIPNNGNEHSLLINVENRHFPLAGHSICSGFPANRPVIQDRRQTRPAKIPRPSNITNLVKSLWWSHGGFDVQRANVLPVLLQQRHQKVGRQMDVLDQFVEGHVNVADGNRQAQHLQA